VSDWHQIVMSGDDIRAGNHERMLYEFDVLLVNAGAPHGADLYQRKDANITGNYTYYFSPLASILAAGLVARYHGTRCSEPDTGEIRPFVQT
jgi:hypothetical protein